jgi:hypothetical protein
VEVIVATETILLVLLLVLVAGLLRSHAEILRRLGPEDAQAEFSLPDPDDALARPAPAAVDLTGTTLDGDAVQIALGPGSPPTLLAFLTSGCSVCHNFWDPMREGLPVELEPDPPRLVVVTKDPDRESPTKLEELRPAEAPLIMSSDAWAQLHVPASPYFVYIEDGVRHGEGSATSWSQIASLLRDAARDARRTGNGDRRADRVDDVLQAAGIGPGHPSLYPADQDQDQGPGAGAK